MVAHFKNIRGFTVGATKGYSPLFSFSEISRSVQSHSNSDILNPMFLISFNKTEMQPLIAKTILHEISTAGTQTKMASLIFKR